MNWEANQGEANQPHSKSSEDLPKPTYSNSAQSETKTGPKTDKAPSLSQLPSWNHKWPLWPRQGEESTEVCVASSKVSKTNRRTSVTKTSVQEPQKPGRNQSMDCTWQKSIPAYKGCQLYSKLSAGAANWIPNTKHLGEREIHPFSLNIYTQFKASTSYAWLCSPPEQSSSHNSDHVWIKSPSGVSASHMVPVLSKFHPVKSSKTSASKEWWLKRMLLQVQKFW